ncbi:hypothetical protein MMC18_002297 [Xylographa bjoerkii]|nr:hypothetical protein [Xylographa bjoerkii]
MMAPTLTQFRQPVVASPSVVPQGDLHHPDPNSNGNTTSATDQERFLALEKRVETLFLQIQQSSMASTLAPSGKALRSSKSKSYFPNSSPLNMPITPEISLPSTPALQPEDQQESYTEIPDTPSAKLSLQILDIIQRYGQNTDDGWVGKQKFLPFVDEYVKNLKPVEMVLPAFPFKSPNGKDKVLGNMPDLGEEVALMHLNGLCESITKVYAPGAQVTIASDGLVYNDLMMIPDSEVWDYSTAIRDIIVAKDLKHIKSFHIVDLLDFHTTQHLTREEYLIHAGCYRRELIAKFSPKNFDSRESVREDKDTCLTYRGYIKFLTKDLKYSPLGMEFANEKRKYKDAIEKLAYDMILRGKIFAAAVNAKCGNFVRLSIHPSVGQTKLSVPLIPPPKGFPLMTPWHSSVLVGLDGSFRTVHADEGRVSHDIIMRDGKPYHFREKSDLWDFGMTKVTFEHLYPCGLIIRPADPATKPSLSEINMKKVRGLAEHQSPVVLRGFADTTDQEVFISKAHELGTVLPCTYGILQEVKDHGKMHPFHNNVVTSEAMPMHYDGMFKFVPEIDARGNPKVDADGKEIKIQKPPRFQYISSIAMAPEGTGYTLFAASRLFFQHLPHPYTVDRFEKITWAMDNNALWDAKLQGLPLVVRHPTRNTPCIRWHEPWDRTKSNLSTCDITIENDVQDVTKVVDSLLCDPRVCLRFTWGQGDVLVSDNTLMEHTRTEFAGECDRELWRIHCD